MSAVLAFLALSAGMPSVAVAADPSPVVLDTVASRKPNIFWTVDPRMAPQIGQSFTLDRAVRADSVSLHPYEIALARKPEYLSAGYRREHFTYLHDEGAAGVTVLLNIWRSSSGAVLPVDPSPKMFGFDVAAGGFTNVYSHTYTALVDLGRPFTLPIEPGLTLDPGVYLVAWYFTPSDPRVFNLRFAGEANGHNYGLWSGTHWGPTTCKAGTLPDSSPQGSAAYAADQWAPPGGASPTGPFPATIGYLTWFRPYETKTPGCTQDPRVAGWTKKGVPIDKNGKPVRNPYGRPWGAASTGDLDMQITGSVL